MKVFLFSVTNKDCVWYTFTRQTFNLFSEASAKKPEALKRVEQITGREVTFYNVDIKDSEALSLIFQKVSDNRGEVSPSLTDVQGVRIVNKRH